MNAHEPTERRGPYLFLLIFLLLAAGLVTVSYSSYRNNERDYRAAAEHQLSAIAELKAGELARYRKERLGDANIIYNNPAFSQLVRRFLEQPQDAEAPRQLQIWMEKCRKDHDFDRVRLLDAQGVTRLSSPAGPPAVSSSVAKDIPDVLRSGRVTFQDFYRSDNDQQIYLGLLVPILDEPDARRPLGVLFLRIDPHDYLYPFIQRWPTPSLTAETLLVRREGNDALFLNELRFQTNTALNLRAPLDRVTMPAVQAALGREDVVEGIDYRGVPVVAALRTIPDSPWALVARVDAAEVYGPMRERLWQMVVLIGSLIFGAGSGVGLVWRHQRVRFYKERAQGAAVLQESEARYRALFETSADGILIADLETKVFKQANPALCRMLGYTHEELRTMGVADLHPREDLPRVMAEFEAQVRGEKTLAADLPCLRKDGTILYADVNATRAVIDRRTCLVGLFRDTTERKRAQAELEDVHKQLVEASRRDGMAEIATNVLHNVGNVLNSVNISVGLIVESVKKSRASRLAGVVVLLREHTHDLGAFIVHDPRGKHVPAHLAQLSEHLLADQEAVVSELDSLRRNVEHIKEIVAMQQKYATFGGVKELVNVVDLVEDSLRLNEGALSRHRVEVIREFEKVPLLNVEKHKILQILVNLERNAKYACDESERADRRLTVRVANGEGRVKISVMDNGIGIPPENLTRIFNHGFTTRQGGHGFGLHSGALAAKEMGGSLTVHSDGPGQGAVFTLELPLPAAGGLP